MNQIAIPVVVSPLEISREKTLGGSIDLCLKAAGLEPKEVQSDLKLDKGQFSRWASGTEGVVWPKLSTLMDFCGNDAPLMWMLHDRGYALDGLRKRESETERQLREAREEIIALRRVIGVKA